MRLPSFRDSVRWLMVVATGALCACESAPPRSTIQVATPQADVAPVYRGMIGSEVEFRNTSPILVSGYGLVVGLNGTGGQPLNDQVAASMERQLGLMGVGRTNDALKGTALEDKSAGDVLRDRNIGVVQVLAAIPPGSPDGATFDVVIRAMNASSVEGGKLWTTDLRIGAPSTFTQAQSRRLGVARGPVYTDPFAGADPASEAYTGASGRILGGGQVVDSQNVVLDLFTPSHARARSIVSAINSRFPSQSGDRGPAARGRTDARIEVEVPERYRRDARSFVSLIQNLQIDQSSPDQYAARFVESIKADPQTGQRLSWALEALGERVLPQVRELYDYPELAPRLSGLKAGARLNDARAVPYLRELTRTGQGSVRTEAISLLGMLDAGPRVDEALKACLTDTDLTVRAAAYEALAERAERAQFVYLARIVEQNRDRGVPDLTPMELEALAQETLPAGLIQGVERQNVHGKFLLDRVRGGTPLLYVTQQETPRLVAFGDDETVRLSGIVSMWDSRLLIAPSDATGELRVQYTRPGTRDPVTATVKASITDLVSLLARKSTPDDPRPGMDMTYSQVVAVLYKVQETGATPHAFATEQDRLRQALASAENSRDMLERPETAGDTEPVLVRRGSGAPTPTTQVQDETPTIVPIVPTVK